MIVLFVRNVLKVCRQYMHGEENPKGRTLTQQQQTRIMTRSAQNDPEIHRLLKRCEELGYPIPLPEKWGVKRAKKNLRLIIEAAGGTDYCPVCGRKIR